MLIQSKKILCLLACLGLLLTGIVILKADHALASPEAKIIYVNHAATGANNGTSWANAFTSLQAALVSAFPGDEIWVAQGVYTPSNVPGRAASFQLQNGVALYGGFAGSETARTQRDWQAHWTVLSGDLDGNDLTDPHGVVTDTAHIIGDNAYHVVTGSALNATTVLDGFTITAGKANGVSTHQNGGGLYNTNNSNPQLANLTFSANLAYHGGGMFNAQSSPSLAGVTFKSNLAGDTGGGLCNDDGHPTLTEVTFQDNRSDDTAGGMYNENSNPALTDVTFVGNQAGYEGGGMVNQTSHPTLTGVDFIDNQADNLGGGMSNRESNPTLVDVNFNNNQAKDGGGMYNDTSQPTLTQVTFSSNTAEGGGGMYNTQSDPALNGVTFNNNQASLYRGGGLANYQSHPTLSEVTFVGNSAISVGGGIYNIDSNPSLTEVTFVANQGSYGGGMANSNSSPSLSHVRFEDNQATSFHGGGMSNSNSSNPTLTDVVFTANQAQQHGGGMFSSVSSNPILTHVTFIGNRANQDGGGALYVIAIGGSTLTNVTFTGNFAGDQGGGLVSDNSSLSLSNVTFSGNQAGQEGGGFYNLNSASTLINCILWGNQAPTGPEIYIQSGTPPGISYSDIQGCGGSGAWLPACGSDGGGNLDSDPAFVAPVAASSAPTSAGNYRLRYDSPTIDTGSNPGVSTPSDLDGQPRLVDGNADSNVRVDLGAYEYQAFTLTIDWSGAGDVSYAPAWPSYTYLDQVVLTATAQDGWVFNGWSGDGDGLANPLVITLTQSASIHAEFNHLKVFLPVILNSRADTP
ncbi:MAG: hypothetical protein JW862_17260 [Anaerolineales bacterium]|nr:hypothetical protein [Anaerolineales bacterium]